MRKGFTMIELVMVIIILAILAAVAIPKFVDMSNEAKVANEAAVVGGVRAGIHTAYIAACKAGACVWPATLDGIVLAAPCSAAAPCFVTVLSQGVTDATWASTGDGLTYTGPNGGSYTYDGAGKFE
ncbi:MAG: type II secretion system protein [Candidatus Omnitrophota bacterium]